MFRDDRSSRNLPLRRFEPDDAEVWDDLVKRSQNGTFLHSRRFLSYHGDRFIDRSVIVNDAKGRVIGVIPAALDPVNPEVVVSHPGSTYGGVVHDGRLSGQAMRCVLSELKVYYSSLGVKLLRYKAVPPIYHHVHSDDDLFALNSLGATNCGCDLASVIDLHDRGKVSQRRRRSLRLAEAAEVKVQSDSDRLPEFWRLLCDNLQQRYDVRPTHSLDEITELRRRFPRVRSSSASRSWRAGLWPESWSFGARRWTTRNTSPQTMRGGADGALDLLLETLISDATVAGKRFFSFGISNVGKQLNAGLHAFKLGFGAGGLVHHTYELDL